MVTTRALRLLDDPSLEGEPPCPCDTCPLSSRCSESEVACLEFGNWVLDRPNRPGEAVDPAARVPTADIFRLTALDLDDPELDDMGGLINPLNPPTLAAITAAQVLASNARPWHPVRQTPQGRKLPRAVRLAPLTQAERVLMWFGGPVVLSKILAAVGYTLSATAMYYWMYTKEQSPWGRGGVVPVATLRALSGLGRLLNRPLPEGIAPPVHTKAT